MKIAIVRLAEFARVVRLVGVCAALLGASACADREHLSDDFGQHSRAFHRKQRVYAQAAQGGPTGLDSEESAAVLKSYRSGLSGGKGASSKDGGQRVLVLGDGPHEGQGN